MELWINGVKVANFPGNHINTNLSIGSFGTYSVEITVVEVDSNGNYIKSAPILFYTAC